jgi:hypothetical protein
LRSSPRACPSCAAAPRTSRPGSTAPDAPTAHRSDRWEGPLPTACSRPMRLGPHPESKPPSHLGGRKSHPARLRQKLLGQALRRQSLKPWLLTAEGTLDGCQRGPRAGARLERRPPKRTRDQHNRERRDNDKLPRRTIVPRDYLGAVRAR